jgi:Cu-Zn family superoxide dismutase
MKPVGILVGVVMGMWCVSASAQTGRAVIRATADGSAVEGQATLSDTPDGLQVSVKVTGVPAGQHGIHLHEFGDCGDGGTAAGGHFNPDGVPHGLVLTDGLRQAHPGDMGNLIVGPDGAGALEVTLPGVSLTDGRYGVAGRAIILHAQPDDFSQPTGNAGGRIGCGSILITGS